MSKPISKFHRRYTKEEQKIIQLFMDNKITSSPFQRFYSFLDLDKETLLINLEKLVNDKFVEKYITPQCNGMYHYRITSLGHINNFMYNKPKKQIPIYLKIIPIDILVIIVTYTFFNYLEIADILLIIYGLSLDIIGVSLILLPFLSNRSVKLIDQHIQTIIAESKRPYLIGDNLTKEFFRRFIESSKSIWSYNKLDLLKNNTMSRLGFILVTVGFTFQIIGNLIR